MKYLPLPATKSVLVVVHIKRLKIDNRTFQAVHNILEIRIPQDGLVSIIYGGFQAS